MRVSAVTRIGPKYQVVIPKKVREAVRLNVGDFVEATAVGQKVLLRPKIVVDRTLEAALEEAIADVGAGRVSRSFRSARALVRDLKRRGRRARPKN
jgi:AbrB family looped-hinge helix DNA binding protein